MKKQQFLLVYSLFIIMIMIFAQKSVHAGTCVKGEVEGVWTIGGSPYIINGEVVTVPDGKTLIIEPGVIVMLRTFNGRGGYISVYGTLIASGEPGNPIIFTGVGNVTVDPANSAHCSGTERRVPGTWGSIRFVDPDSGSILENCQIIYGGRGDGGTIHTEEVKNGNLTISECIIANGASDGIIIGGIGGSPNIINTIIQNHKGAGIFEKSRDSQCVVDGCVFIGNGDAAHFNRKYPIVAFADNIKNYTNLFIWKNILDAIWVWGEFITSATWQDHRVPYHVAPAIVSDNVTISDGETLILEAGVEINFGVSRGLYVHGTLIADGDSCKHIIFDRIDTSSTDKNWSSISFEGSDPGTILDYCDISFGGAYRNATIDIKDVNTNVLISNCRISYSDTVGLNIVGNSAPFILNNLISENSLQGIRVATLPGFTPVLRNNLISNNNEGVRIVKEKATLDLGTTANPGHNAFVNNLNYELVNLSDETIFAIYNYWVDTDSAIIDTVHIYDDDESINSGPVMFMPFDFVDQSKPPRVIICPPSCEGLSITITTPTTAPMFQTTSRFITLGGTAIDDHGVAGITWLNSTTGDTGEAALGAPRNNLSWTASQIPLVTGENIITVKAFDLDQCTASDEIIVTFIELPDSCWAFDTFDDLALGSLNRKNGWFTVSGRSDAMVIPDTTDPVGVSKVLELDPAPGQQIVMEKFITTQTDSVHTIELLVRIEPGDTSMAKIEVKTNGPNWDKKFQLYFGTSMRLNYGPTQPEAIGFLSRVEPQRWYHVKAVVDLETDSVDLFLDDILVLSSIAVNPGPITMLSISAWDLPGSVLFDDIHGCKLCPITHVELLKSPELPQRFSLSPNYPNPFNLSTTSRFALPAASDVTLIIYDLFGKEVRKLVAGRYEAGIYSVSWDGRNNLGRAVSSGVYFIKMRAGDFVSVNKMTLVK